MEMVDTKQRGTRTIKSPPTFPLIFWLGNWICKYVGVSRGVCDFAQKNSHKH